ncbi:MAG: AraC family transcriptional regulator [Bacteroidota bacterium]
MNRSLAVRDVALLSGYTSLSNFSRDFTKATGLSPAAWRGQIACSYKPADAAFITL